MEYETSYQHLKGQAKRDEALSDIQNYCTPEQFNILETIAMGSTEYRELLSLCSIVGFIGYPVKALWNETRQTMRDMTT